MVIFASIVVVVILIALLYLLKSTGRFGQAPSTRERMRHNEDDNHGPGPRATGLN
jgi:hypothetical protein